MGERTYKRNEQARSGGSLNASAIHHSSTSGCASEPGRPVDLEHRQSRSRLLIQRPLVSDLQQRTDRVMFTEEEEYQQFLGWCNYNTDAADFLRLMFKASQNIDDVQDREGNVLSLLVRIVHDTTFCMVGNKFYQQHHALLSPVMLCSLMNWYVSAKWEKEEGPKKHFAFVLRESLDQVIFLTAYLCGGVDHAMAVAESVLEFYHIKHGEDFLSWRP